MPTKVLAIELTKPLQAIYLENRYDSVKILVFVNNRPLKWIVFYGLKHHESIQPKQILNEIQNRAGWQLVMQHIIESGAPWIASDMSQRYSIPISVVICIENNGKQLESCLSSLFKSGYRKLEVIVVDIMPLNDIVSKLVSNYPVKYVCENKSGLNNARNRGIAESNYDIISFIDADTTVGSQWFNTIAAAFSKSEVLSVGGYVAPLELETISQRAFEANYIDTGLGFERGTIRKLDFDAKKLAWISSLALRTNVAFRRDAFHKLGFFNVSYDQNISGYGIIDFFDRVIVNDFAIAYEPSMVLWHNNQYNAHIIQKKVSEFSKIFWYYAIHCFFSKKMNNATLLKFLLKYRLLGKNIRNLFRAHGGVPKKFTLREIKGMGYSLLMWNHINRRAQKQAMKS